MGGTRNEEGIGIVVDRNGNVYVTGRTNSEDFPVSPNAFDKNLGNGSTASANHDVFITKINLDASAILYSTYLGDTAPNSSEFRSLSEFPGGIAIDSTGNIYVAGTTPSEHFPVTTDAIDIKIGTGRLEGQVFIKPEDIFVSKFNSTLSTLLYSTFIGGDSADIIGTWYGVYGGYGVYNSAIAVDKVGNAWIAGITNSNSVSSPSVGFPITEDAYDKVLERFQNRYPYTGTDLDGFLVKLDASGSRLLYSTYIGGRTGGEVATSVAVDSVGAVYVTGHTESADFYTTRGLVHDTTHNGGADAFIMKFGSHGREPVYSSFIGGSLWEMGVGIAVDKNRNVYVAGVTGSYNFPIKGENSRPYDSLKDGNSAK